MATDLRRLAIKLATNALQQSAQAAAPPQPTPKKPHISTGRAMMLGAGLLAAGQALASPRGREVIGTVRERIADSRQHEEDYEDDEDDEEYDDEPEGEGEEDFDDEEDFDEEEDFDDEEDEEPEAEEDEDFEDEGEPEAEEDEDFEDEEGEEPEAEEAEDFEEDEEAPPKRRSGRRTRSESRA